MRHTKESNGTINFILIASCISWLYTEPYILIKASETGLPTIYITLQAIKYALLLLPPLYWLITRGIDFKWLYLLIIYTATILGYTALSITKGVSTENILLSFKNIYLWLLYILFFCSSNISFSPKALKYTLFMCVLLSLINIIYSIYIDIYFSGDYAIFFFYDYFLKKEMFAAWNYARNGEVRAFGLLGSPLTLSQSLIISIIFTSILAKSTKWRNLIFFIAISSFIIYGLYLTRTRNPAIALVASTAWLYIVRIKKQATPKLALLIFSLIYATTIFLAFFFHAESMGDLSSQARIPMLLEFTSAISTNPFGYGLGSTGIANKTYIYFFESSAATVLMDIGLIGGALYWGCFMVMAYKLVFLVSDRRKTVQGSYLATGLALVSLLFMTNFSNIFDSSLLIYSLTISVAIKSMNTQNNSVRRI